MNPPDLDRSDSTVSLDDDWVTLDRVSSKSGDCTLSFSRSETGSTFGMYFDRDDTSSPGSSESGFRLPSFMACDMLHNMGFAVDPVNASAADSIPPELISNAIVSRTVDQPGNDCGTDPKSYCHKLDGARSATEPDLSCHKVDGARSAPEHDE
eukprot:900660_1